MNPKLSWTGFTLKYPKDFEVKRCTEFSYVQFDDGGGKLRSQFGIGWLQGSAGPPQSDWLIRQIVSQFEAKFPAGTTFTEKDTSPLSARGRELSRHDYRLDLSKEVGAISAERYAFRVVLLPKDSAFGGGLTIIMMRRVETSIADGFDWLDERFTPMVESIEF